MARPFILVVLPALLWSVPAESQRADFLFERPRVSVVLFGGWSSPREAGDLFDFTRTELTVDRGAFAAPVLGGELGIWVTDRLELAGGVEHTRGRERSEFRDWVGTDDLPITQVTEVRSTRGALTARYFLLDRGRSLGRHAWIPASWSPYVGGGGALVWYEFVQDGEFVDFETLEIFEARLRSEGRGGGGHLVGGVDVTVSPSVALRGEFRYLWDDAAIDRGDFRLFDRIDLGGARITLGVALRH